MTHPDYPALGRHRLDPSSTHEAITRFAPLVARGILTVSECLPTLIDHAKRHGYHGDASGLQARLSHALTDQADAISMARNNAERMIRRDAWKATDTLAPSAEILKAARASTDLLTSAEIKAIVFDVLAAWMRQRRYRHG